VDDARQRAGSGERATARVVRASRRPRAAGPGRCAAARGFDGRVYAYAADGPQAQPLAVVRRPVSELPLDFKLDDSLAAKPQQQRLSQTPKILIGARLGPGGESLAQVGDWLAASQAVAPGARGVRLVLLPPPK
jgi:cytochrome c-type biogenesis protein CcmH